MISVIWKFQFNIVDEFMLMIPRDARFLHADIQAGVPCMWLMVDPNAEIENVKFMVIGTGNHFDGFGNIIHRSTFQDKGFVWHLFEDIGPPGVVE